MGWIMNWNYFGHRAIRFDCDDGDLSETKHFCFSFLDWLIPPFIPRAREYFLSEKLTGSFVAQRNVLGYAFDFVIILLQEPSISWQLNALASTISPSPIDLSILPTQLDFCLVLLEIKFSKSFAVSDAFNLQTHFSFFFY